MFCKYFLPFDRSPFHSIGCILWYTEDFNFDVVQFMYFFFLLLPSLSVSYVRNHCKIQNQEAFPLCFLLSIV